MTVVRPGVRRRAGSIASIAFIVLARDTRWSPLLWLGRGMTFFSDEWAFIETRTLTDPATWLQPHNEHWVTLPAVAYRRWSRPSGWRSVRPVPRHSSWPCTFWQRHWCFGSSDVGRQRGRPGRGDDRAVLRCRLREPLLGVSRSPSLARHWPGLRASTSLTGTVVEQRAFAVAIAAGGGHDGRDRSHIRGDHRDRAGVSTRPAGVAAPIHDPCLRLRRVVPCLRKAGIGAHRDPFTTDALSQVPDFVRRGVGDAFGSVIGVGPDAGPIFAVLVGTRPSARRLAGGHPLPSRFVAGMAGILAYYSLWH